MNKLRFFCEVCVFSFFLFNVGVPVSVSGKPAPSSNADANVSPKKQPKGDLVKTNGATGINKKDAVAASVTAGAPAANGSANSTETLVKDSKKLKESTSKNINNNSIAKTEPTKQTSLGKKNPASSNANGTENTLKSKSSSAKKTSPLDGTATVNTDSDDDHFPSSWSVENENTEDTPENFASMQNQTNDKKEGALNDAKLLLYGGIVLVVFSVLGTAFFTIFLIKKNRRKSKSSFDLYKDDEWGQ